MKSTCLTKPLPVLGDQSKLVAGPYPLSRHDKQRNGRDEKDAGNKGHSTQSGLSEHDNLELGNGQFKSNQHVLRAFLTAGL